MQDMRRSLCNVIAIGALVLVGAATELTAEGPALLDANDGGGDSVSAGPPIGAEDNALKQRLEGLASQLKGRVSLYAVQLNTGKMVAMDADRPVQTASVIKLAILFEAM